MKRMLLAPVALVTAATVAQAQMPERKPGAEEARIAYYAGQWTFEGETMDSPMGPGGKIKGTETCEWFTGGFQLVCRTDVTGPRGAAKGQAVMAYDPSAATYTYYGISSMGDNFFVRGTVSGKVWSWNMDMTAGDQAMQMRVTVTEQTPTAYQYKMEMSVDGGPWTTVEHGTSTKHK